MPANEIQKFDTILGKLEIVEEDGKELCPATEFALMLGYTNPHKAIVDHCRWVTKREVGVQTGIKADGTPAIQTISKNYITEGDMYRLVIRSKLPQAEQFERQVFDEILPSIRKHGMYAVDDLLDNPDLLIEAATRLKEERAARRLAEAHAEYLAHRLDEAKDYYTVKRVAKLNNIKWSKLNWRRLKNTSDYLGYEYPKIFDANYGEVNTYHLDVWKHEYPELRYA